MSPSAATRLATAVQRHATPLVPVVSSVNPPAASPSPVDPAEMLRAIKPHDALPFGELAESYNFLNISSYARVLTNQIVGELRSRGGGVALDVGCGRGIGRDVGYQWAVRDAADGFWGLEPDEGVQPVDGLFDNFQHALMETADLPADTFDVAYSSMVMEHVADPEAFFGALRRCLKPGGVYLFATPNAASLVPWLTKVTHRLKIDEFALRLVRGQSEIDEYHYPVQFRCNSVKQVRRICQQNGFDPPGFAFVEGTGSYNYFRGPLKPLGVAVKLRRRVAPTRGRLATMICRMQKSAA